MGIVFLIKLFELKMSVINFVLGLKCIFFMCLMIDLFKMVVKVFVVGVVLWKFVLMLLLIIVGMLY